MIIRRFNKLILIISTIASGSLLIFSFLAAFAEDEGTLSHDSFLILFAKLFHVFRFPTNIIFDIVLNSYSETYFIIGLIINCFFYGFIIERIIAFIKAKKN